MLASSLIQYCAFLAIVWLGTQPVGRYLANVFERRPTPLDGLLLPMEKAIHKGAGVDPQREMRWQEYAASFLLFTLAGTLLLYLLQRVQFCLPTFLPAYMTTPMTPDLAMNNAISFSTTTTWQAYAGETTLSAITQTVGLAAQNFLAGAGGLAVGIAFIRGFVRSDTQTIGNLWFDVVRALLWVLLPISIVGAMLLVWQGVPMNFNDYTRCTGLEGHPQVVAQGPVAALEFIKNLGTNGGGFFNANGAHPFENPTAFTNVLEMLAIVVLPAALTATFGQMIERPRQGKTIFGVMLTLTVAGLYVCNHAEQAGLSAVRAQHVTTQASAGQPGGNMEGKEMRFGIAGSVLTSVVTSNGATGSVNASQDSYSPVGGLVTLSNMLLGEIAFGGLGTGIYSILMVALAAVFLAGLMVGRTPEYLSKNIGPAEIKLVVVYMLACPTAIMVLTAIAVRTEAGLAGLTTNSGAQGFCEVIYAYASCAANNGMSLAGLRANSPFYNVTTAIAMMVGRFALAIPALALAGRLASQHRRAVTIGTLPTDTWLFGGFMLGTAVIMGGLSFLPALALGPIVEHLTLLK